MKKILAVVLAALMIVSVPAVYAAEMDVARSLSPEVCAVDGIEYYPVTETWGYYYDCGDGTHKYVYGYFKYCGGCGHFYGWYETYEETDGTPHSFDENGECYCGATQGK